MKLRSHKMGTILVLPCISMLAGCNFGSPPPASSGSSGVSSSASTAPGAISPSATSSPTANSAGGGPSNSLPTALPANATSNLPVATAVPVASSPSMSVPSRSLPIWKPTASSVGQVAQKPSTQNPLTAANANGSGSSSQPSVRNIPYVPISAASSGATGTATASPAPPAVPPARQPAPNRRYVKVQHLALPGLNEIPDNCAIPCYFPKTLDASTMQVGDLFTVAAEPPRGSGHLGGAHNISSFPKGTLIEFEVTAVHPGNGLVDPSVEMRAKCLLMPDREDADTDIAIPLATASLVSPEDAGPSSADRFASARRGEEVGSTIGQLSTFNSNHYFNGGAAGKALGYFMGRAKEDAAGVSVLTGKMDAGSECVVRVNRRVLY